MRFENNPTSDEMYCFPIVRPRHKKPLAFTVATRCLRGVYVHWFGGKTIACCSPATCEACEANVKRVWTGHVLGYRHCDDQVCLVPFTLPTKEFFAGHAWDHDEIFSVSVRLVRMGGRESGPVACIYLGRDRDRTMIKMEVLETILERLYADNANKRTVQIT
jgi:hypothetical protein